MEICLHWTATHVAEGDLVTRTCQECGASGSKPRCAAARKDGERCNRVAADDLQTCLEHGRPLCAGVTLKGEPCARRAVPGIDHCPTHASPLQATPATGDESLVFA